MVHFKGYREQGLGKHFYVFILPAFLLYLIFFIFPFFQGIEYSFLNWNGIDPEIPNQMEEKKFQLLVCYNIPISLSVKNYEEKFLPQIRRNFYKEYVGKLYKLTPDGSEYILDTSLDDSVYQEVLRILREYNCSVLLSEKDKNKILSHYRKIDSDYVLQKETSMFERRHIKVKLKRVFYENVKNVGLANYQKTWKDPKFKEVVSFTLFFTFFNVLLINLCGLLLALALDSRIRSKNCLRTMFFLPNVISLIIVAYIWSFIYREVFSAVYAVTGWKIFSVNWLVYEKTAPWAVVLTSVWQGIGYVMVIYLAGLQTIPNDILEVASIDGAGGIRKFMNITLPLLFPSMTICFFITLTNSLKTFEIMLALTDGANKTTSFVLNIYLEAFRRNRVGYSTAQAIILLVVIMIVSLLQLVIMKKREIEY